MYGYLRFLGGPFDSILLLGHGIGMVEDLPGLDRFLGHARRLTGNAGQLLPHSLDVRQTEDPSIWPITRPICERGVTWVRFAFGSNMKDRMDRTVAGCRWMCGRCSSLPSQRTRAVR